MALLSGSDCTDFHYQIQAKPSLLHLLFGDPPPSHCGHGRHITLSPFTLSLRHWVAAVEALSGFHQTANSRLDSSDGVNRQFGPGQVQEMGPV